MLNSTNRVSAHVLWADDALDSAVRLDSLVAVVDCLNFTQTLTDPALRRHAEMQVSH